MSLRDKFPGSSKSEPKHRIRRGISYIDDKCIDCGNSSMMGIAIIKEKKNGSDYTPEWIQYRCPICSQDRERSEIAVIENIAKINDLPQYTIMCDPDQDTFLIRSPSGASRRVYGTTEKGIDRCQEILDRETPDAKFKSVWVNDDTDVIGVGLHNTSEDAPEYFWLKYRQSDRKPTMHEDVEGHAPDSHPDDFRAISESEWTGETINSVKTDVNVAHPYSHQLSKHSSFETEDDRIVGFLPGECPVCGEDRPTRLFTHQLEDGGFLVEHRAEGCNRIIGKPSDSIYRIDRSPPTVEQTQVRSEDDQMTRNNQTNHTNQGEESVGTSEDTQDILDEVEEVL